ncbi:MAG: VanZ family protein [Polynucleobacter sp.]|jgi:VanZ family protein|nr:VanZ family protein [Polynucleobacter sp.]
MTSSQQNNPQEDLSPRGPRPQLFLWPLQAMPLARAVTLLYVLLILYGCLSPFDFNIQIGVPVFAWWQAPFPQFIGVFELSMNVLGYIPLGFLCVFALYPRYQDFVALLMAIFFSALLAASIESLQTWIPTRIPSQSDWIANTLGAFIGALLAIPLGPKLLSGSAILQGFDSWFGADWLACALFLLFPFAQIYPQNSWLGLGAWGFMGETQIDWGTMVMNHTMQEILITTLAWLAFGLLLSLSIRPSHSKWSKWKLLITLLLVSTVIKTFFTALQFNFSMSLSWLTAGAFWGMVIGSILLYYFLDIRRSCILYMSFIAILILLIVVNYLPENPYFNLALRVWRQGGLVHFNELMQWFSWLWLSAAFFYLFRQYRKLN